MFITRFFFIHLEVDLQLGFWKLYLYYFPPFQHHELSAMPISRTKESKKAVLMLGFINLGLR
jgi:hypothetical protein